MIVGFARIEIAAADPGAADAFADFLGRRPERASSGSRFALANLDLQVRPPEGNEREGLARVVFAVPDLALARRMLDRRGVPTRETDGEAVVEAAASHGVGVGLIAAEPCADPSAMAADQILGLDHVVIRTSDPERAIAFYGARLGLDFRLDRSNPAWGSRLLFFRCGDAVVEIAADPGAARSDAPDVLGGLAFRARDPDAVRARLAGGAMDVSEVRPGRKPGTRVFTLRSGVVGAPALVIGGAED